MAITKMHPIRRTLNKAVEYITDEYKTAGEIYVSTYGCTRETIEDDFEYTRRQASYHGTIIAQHIIQSFAEGEITPEQAHKIGIELAGRFTNHKHEYIIATHVDKGHIHNHIIMNHVDFKDHARFRGNIRAVKDLRCLSDEICESQGLSVIKDPQNKGKSFYEWQLARKGLSYKKRLKDNIDMVIPLVDSYDGFLEKMKELGYEIKQGKYDSFRINGQERFTRSKTLGEDYTREAIELRIKAAPEQDGAPAITHPTYIRVWKYDQSLGLIENTHSYLIFVTNNYQRRKTAITDSKKIAATYNLLREKNIDSADNLNAMIISVKDSMKDTHKQIRAIDTDLATINEAIKYLDRTRSNKPVWDEYVKSGKSSSFYESHRADLMIYESAFLFLSRNKIPPDSDLDAFRDQAESLEEQRCSLYATLQGLQKESKELDMIKQNVDIIMSDGNRKDQRNQKKKKERE